MEDKKDTTPLSEQEIKHCLETLEHLIVDTNQLYDLPEETRVALLTAAGKLSRPNKSGLQKRRKDHKTWLKRKQQERDKHARKETGIRSARENPVFIAPTMISLTGEEANKRIPLASPRKCYVCKAEFDALHHFYDTMCEECAEFNYAKRFQTADMKGQVAIITGSRLKIGYHCTLMMLRSGATVIATTRFPHDSAIRFAKEEDFTEWGHRLKIHGLDLRHIPSVELFCKFIEQRYKRLDVLINNAAQTVRRPSGFYQHLMEAEMQNFDELPQYAQELLIDHEACVRDLQQLNDQHLMEAELQNFDELPQYAQELLIDHEACVRDLQQLNDQHLIGDNKNLPVSWQSKNVGIGLTASAELSQIPYSIDQSLSPEEVFPEGELDADLQQVDLRKTNSWRLKLGEVSANEMLEVQLVNSVAPFVLCNHLAALMKKENTGMKHVINVSAMEGKFHRFYKEDRHPHTNMAKAALNMMTHTAATDFAKFGIFMNAVDTGWVTDEDPAELAKKKEEDHDFQPPLDIVDGAARVMDPLFDGINTGKHWSGKFLKDYRPIDW